MSAGTVTAIRPNAGPKPPQEPPKPRQPSPTAATGGHVPRPAGGPEHAARHPGVGRCVSGL